MPDFLKAWIATLTSEQAVVLWEWLNSEEDPVEDIILKLEAID